MDKGSTVRVRIFCQILNELYNVTGTRFATTSKEPPRENYFRRIWTNMPRSECTEKRSAERYRSFSRRK